LLDWLVAQRAWELLSAAACAEIRSRMEESMGLRAGALGTVDDRGILERIEAGGAAASRVLLLNEILGSLQNETKDGGVCQVENLLGVQITKDEWDDWLMASVYGDPELRIPPEGGPFVVAPAPTDADGRVTQSAVSGRSVALTDEQILVFVRTGGVYTGVRTEVEATPGEVLVLAEHYVRVRAAAKVDVELNESLLKD